MLEGLLLPGWLCLGPQVCDFPAVMHGLSMNVRKTSMRKVAEPEWMMTYCLLGVIVNRMVLWGEDLNLVLVHQYLLSISFVSGDAVDLDLGSMLKDGAVQNAIFYWEIVKWSDTCSYRMRKTPHTNTHILSIFTLNQLSRSQSHVKYERFYTDSWFMFKQKFKAHSEVNELGHWLWAHGTGERSSLLIPATDHSQSRWIAQWSKSGQHITYKKNLKHRMYRAGGGANNLEDN